jgi:ribonucleoside-diphosphate reductase alpha chain
MTLTDTVQGPTDVAFESVEKTNKTGDYFALNAQLNFWKTDENGKPVVDDNGRKQIPFEKDKEAVKAYFLNHVNPNTQWFTNLGEKLKYLIEEEYYEKAFFDLYDFEFVKKVFKQVYDHNFRFPTFYGAYKYYSAYTLKTFDGQRYLERFEDRIAITALYLAQGNKKLALSIAEEIITGRLQPATPTFLNSGKAQRGELVSCFEAGTLIDTASGQVPIEEITEGDYVLTHDGTYQAVTQLMSKTEDYGIYTLKITGSTEGISATPEHPVLVAKGKKNTAATNEPFIGDGSTETLKWTAIKDVKPGDFIAATYPTQPALKETLKISDYVDLGRWKLAIENGQLVPKTIDLKNNRKKDSEDNQQLKTLTNTIPLNEDFGRFVGYYLAEGYVHVNRAVSENSIKGLRFTFGTKEVAYIADTLALGEKLFGIAGKTYENKDGSTNVSFWSKTLGDFFLKLTGSGFNKKLLPNELLISSPEFLKALLVGTFRGDGCTLPNGIAASLTNLPLIHQLRMAALRAGLLPYARTYVSASGKLAGEIRISSITQENHNFVLSVDKNIHNYNATSNGVDSAKFAYWQEGHPMYRVGGIELEEKQVPVYNLEVENNHTYSVNGFLVHNCFLLNVDDDLNSILRAVNSAGQLSKRGGGVALCLTNLRAKGDPIKKMLNQASGVVPVMKLLEDTFSYANQLGQRQGAGAVYLNAHHPDIMEFLDTKRENADEKIRIKTLSMGVVIPDITFELMRNKEPMYLFSPYDVEKEYGVQMAFINVTEKYREMVDNPRIHKKKIDPREFFSTLAELQMESGYPYIMFEDAVNRASALDGKIIMSNLCSEILQPQEPSVINDDQTYATLGKDISCNLASLNVRKAIESPNFGQTIETAIRLLTQVSDMSDIVAVPTVASGNKRSHSVGLGAMNLAGTFGLHHMYYGDEESLDLTNMYFRTVTYHAIRTSMTIAKERKEAFDGFEKSAYATGAYFEKFYDERFANPVTKKVAKIFADNNIQIIATEDWKKLAADVKKHGMYNQNLQAVPPTGSISYISNATASIHGITAKTEKRKEGKASGIFPAPEMTNENQEYFIDAYEIGPEKEIDVYSIASWYVDQGLSLTLFFKDNATTATINRAQIYAFSKGKPSKKEPDERAKILARYVSGSIKTIYYIRLQAQVINGIEMSECVSCAL